MPRSPVDRYVGVNAHIAINCYGHIGGMSPPSATDVAFDAPFISRWAQPRLLRTEPHVFGSVADCGDEGQAQGDVGRQPPPQPRDLKSGL